VPRSVQSLDSGINSETLRRSQVLRVYGLPRYRDRNGSPGGLPSCEILLSSDHKAVGWTGWHGRLVQAPLRRRCGETTRRKENDNDMQDMHGTLARAEESIIQQLLDDVTCCSGHQFIGRL